MITKMEVENVIREVERQNGVLDPRSVERANLNEKQLVVLLDVAKAAQFKFGELVQDGDDD